MLKRLIVCDGCGQAALVGFQPYITRNLLKKIEGWHCELPGGRDLCAKCWKAGERSDAREGGERE
jgi:hypothetical protein